VLEVLQYGPKTTSVHQIPVVVVPPQINKFYFMDLSPGRSLTDYSLQHGLQFFAISWRNPTKEYRDWDLDTYGQAIIRALDAVQEITESDQVHLFGLCAGGITTSTVLNHLTAVGDDRVRSVSFGVTLLDMSVPAQAGAMMSVPLLKLAALRSRATGVLDGQSLASVFTWMRPNDLVWNYWVNDYLMGKKPAPFDILAWNADRTNLPAALHAQFLEMFATNVLAQPRGMTVLGSPVDLSQIKVDAYVTGGTTDHLTPWKGCYRSAQLLGGDSTFVLANTGHIQTLICPPNNPKARYWVGGEPGPDPDAWKAGAEERTGTWWGTGRSGSSRGPGPRNRHRPSWATPPIRCWAARRAPTCTCRPDLAMPMALGPHQLGSQQIRRPHKPATPQTGDPQTGDPQTGDPQTGDPQTGDPQTGAIRLGPTASGRDRRRGRPGKPGPRSPPVGHQHLLHRDSSCSVDRLHSGARMLDQADSTPSGTLRAQGGRRVTRLTYLRGSAAVGRVRQVVQTRPALRGNSFDLGADATEVALALIQVCFNLDEPGEQGFELTAFGGRGAVVHVDYFPDLGQ